MLQNHRGISIIQTGGVVTITYEYPFNERIRTLLRLEDLFEKSAYFIQQDGRREHHVALLALFEILDVAGRADLKMDLIQELERQRQTLLGFRNNPEISEEALSGALYEIEQSSAALLAMAGKLGQHLRENEWLMGIKGRAAIPAASANSTCLLIIIGNIRIRRCAEGTASLAETSRALARRIGHRAPAAAIERQRRASDRVRRVFPVDARRLRFANGQNHPRR